MWFSVTSLFWQILQGGYGDNTNGVKPILIIINSCEEKRLPLLTKLAQWVDQNKIRVNVDRTFPLEEAAKALDYQKNVHPRGKVVLAIR